MARLVRSVHRSRTHARIERGMIDPHRVQVLRFRTVNGRIIDPDLSWKKPGREFSYQGRMHDVVRTFHLGRGRPALLRDLHGHRVDRMKRP